MQSDIKRQALFNGNLYRLLKQEDMLSLMNTERTPIWLSVDSALSAIAGISLRRRQCFRVLVKDIMGMAGIDPLRELYRRIRSIR